MEPQTVRPRAMEPSPPLNIANHLKPRCKDLEEDGISTIAEGLDHRREGEPLRDLLARAQALAELGARELRDLEALLLGLCVGKVAAGVPMLLTDVHHVGVADHLHEQLILVFLAGLLSVE